MPHPSSSLHAARAVVVAPAGPGDWERARGLVGELFSFLEGVSGVTVADAQPAAVGEVRDLEAIYSPPNGYFFVARLGGDFVGTTALHVIDAATVELKRVYVEPAARGLGIASQMLEAAIVQASEAGYGRIVLESHAEYMSAAVAMYRARGFREVPAYTDLGERVEGVITMELRLPSPSKSKGS